MLTNWHQRLGFFNRLSVGALQAVEIGANLLGIRPEGSYLEKTRKEIFSARNVPIIEIPQLLDFSNSKLDSMKSDKTTEQYLTGRLKIMKFPVRVSLFRQVMNGYEITYDEETASRLRHAGYGFRVKDTMKHVSAADAIEFAKRLSFLTGRTFMVPTEEQFVAAARLGQQAREVDHSSNLHMQSGEYDYTLTLTPAASNKGATITRHEDRQNRATSSPISNHNLFVIRLVEVLTSTL